MATSRVADVVIAGAGMAGIAAAYQLAVRAGVRRVVLVDPRDPLTLTSNKGTEAYRNYWPGPDDTMARFIDRSIDLLDELDHESRSSFELNRRGYVFLTADPAEAERVRQQDAPSTQFVSGERAIRAQFPYVTGRVVAMLHVRRAGYMNAVKLGQWLLARACAHGVQLVRDEVQGFSLRGGRVSAVRLASGDQIEARAFVLAVGPLLPAWVSRLDLGVPIVTERHGKVSVEDTDGIIPRDAPLMIWNDTVALGALGAFAPALHLRPRGARSVLGVWTYDPRVEPAVFPPSFPPGYAEVVLRGLAVVVPGLSAHVGRAHEAVVDGGYYCKAPDNRPLVGPTGIDGIYLLGALSGFGIMASQAAAQLLAAHLLDQPLPDYAQAFHPRRFHDPAYQATLAALAAQSGQL